MINSDVDSIHASTQHRVEWLVGQSSFRSIGSRCWISPARQVTAIASAHVAATQVSMHISTSSHVGEKEEEMVWEGIMRHFHRTSLLGSPASPSHAPTTQADSPRTILLPFREELEDGIIPRGASANHARECDKISPTGTSRAYPSCHGSSTVTNSSYTVQTFMSRCAMSFCFLV